MSVIQEAAIVMMRTRNQEISPGNASVAVIVKKEEVELKEPANAEKTGTKRTTQTLTATDHVLRNPKKAKTKNQKMTMDSLLNRRVGSSQKQQSQQVNQTVTAGNLKSQVGMKVEVEMAQEEAKEELLLILIEADLVQDLNLGLVHDLNQGHGLAPNPSQDHVQGLVLVPSQDPNHVPSQDLDLNQDLVPNLGHVLSQDHVLNRDHALNQDLAQSRGHVPNLVLNPNQNLDLVQDLNLVQGLDLIRDLNLVVGLNLDLKALLEAEVALEVDLDHLLRENLVLVVIKWTLNFFQ